MRCIVIAGLFSVFIAPAQADTTGRAAVIDGDTLMVMQYATGLWCERARAVWLRIHEAVLELGRVAPGEGETVH